MIVHLLEYDTICLHKCKEKSKKVARRANERKKLFDKMFVGQKTLNKGGIR